MATTETTPKVRARTGQQFLDELARDEREIWLEGERIGNPLEHPKLDAGCPLARARLRPPARAPRRAARCPPPTTARS